MVSVPAPAPALSQVLSWLQMGRPTMQGYTAGFGWCHARLPPATMPTHPVTIYDKLGAPAEEQGWGGTRWGDPRPRQQPNLQQHRGGINVPSDAYTLRASPPWLMSA